MLYRCRAALLRFRSVELGWAAVLLRRRRAGAECRRRAAAVSCGRLIDQDARHFGAGVEILRRAARGDAAGVRFSELFPAFFAESRNSVCHAVEGDDEPSVVVGLGDAAVFEKVFYVRSRRDAVR